MEAGARFVPPSPTSHVCAVCRVYSAFSGFGLMMRCDTHWLAARGKGPSSTVSVNTGLIDV